MDNSQFLVPISPSQMLEKASDTGVSKASVRILPMILLAFQAGLYIAFGGVFSAIAATGMSGVWPFGAMKILQGIAFSLGLILVVVGGAELFTGNMLMIVAWIQHRISTASVLRNWVIVYIGNFLGSIFLAVLIALGKTYSLSGGELGSVFFKIANTKLHYGFIQALILGILCNILVCLAVWLTYSARNTTDKIVSVIFPITAFIAAGFEHSVANMFLIPLTFFIQYFDPNFAAGLNMDLTGFTWSAFLLKNLIPVTIGNIIGGAVFVGLVYYLSYHKTTKKM